MFKPIILDQLVARLRYLLEFQLHYLSRGFPLLLGPAECPGSLSPLLDLDLDLPPFELICISYLTYLYFVRNLGKLRFHPTNLYGHLYSEHLLRKRRQGQEQLVSCPSNELMAIRIWLGASF
jgi:hypothetical protein